MGDSAMDRGERVNILVVDDSADNRLSLETILTEPGQHVVTAASGRDALRRLLEKEFAVILLDVKMPVMDGFETAALVRQRKSSERTPIIFITAFSDEVHIARGYSLGAVDYIVSPVVPEILRSKVAVFVELFRKTEQIRRQAESLRHRGDQLYHLTEASLAINSVNSLGEIVEIVTETARDLLAPRCAVTTTTVDPAQRAPRPSPLAVVEDGTEECDQQRFVQQAAAMTTILADQGRTVLITAGELTTDPRWAFLGESAAAMSGWLAAPLTGRDGRCFGWVHLAGRAREGSGAFVDEDKTILTQLAQVASIAIENTLSSEAREANRLKDEFLTTLSHELRTPLTAILGWTRVLRTAAFDEARCAHGLEVIERNVTAQTKLIEDLLDVSRIIAGKLRVNLRPIPLLPSIETAVEAMRPAAEAKGMALVLELGPGLDRRATIAGDTDRLQQVGWNLVSNAIKFTPPGGRIVIAVSRAAEGFQVRVTDTGKGISPQFMAHVFDRFRQDDSSSTRAHGGLGIGLAIVRHIVELHGGRVEAESPGVNRGATFTVSLPELLVPIDSLPATATTAAGGEQAAAPLALAGAPGAAPPVGANDLARLRLVVVDDDPDTSEILSEILRSAGATVATAASLAEALALCDQLRPDLLISDIAMPGGDGYALIRQLRRRGPQRGGLVPAIAVSAHAREEDRRRALAAGFERYVTKPVEPVDLLVAVRETAFGGGGTMPDAALASSPAAAVPGTADGHAHAGRNGRHRAGDGAEEAPDGEAGSRRILLVEDDADTREALKTLLELSGHEVAVASDGGEAVAHVIAYRPDVALVDIGLPEIDGNEVARRIRALLGPTGIFLIALTGYGGEADEELARAAGFDAHFTKPVELSRLDRLLRASPLAGLA